VSVAVSIGLAAILGIQIGNVNMLVAVKEMFNSLNKFPLAAIPFFILAGNLMETGGISRRLVEFAKSIVGGVQGGLPMTCVLTCMIFAAVSGSSVATTFAIGAILIPALVKHGYPPNYAAALQATSAELGVIIPPSIPMILYGVAAEVSIGELFIAGFGPGIFIGVSLMVFVHIYCRFKGWGKNDGVGRLTFGRATIEAAWALLMPVIILGGILSGAFTATESASIAVAWALFITVFVYRSLTWENFLKACAKACKTTGVVLLLIGISGAFGYFMALYEVPQLTGELMKSFSSEPWVIFLMINVLLFILGTFLDMAATILICTPIFLPIAMQFGMDPLQFGILMLINCALGLNTPPVGTVQFVGCAIGGISVGQVMRTIAPFYTALGMTLLAVTYVPAFSLWLPALLK
jgi:tripartite ATP-independent transporter DctM subunit